MAKIDLALGSKVYYTNKEYVIVRIVNFKTVTLKSIADDEKVINVDIKDLHSKPIEEKILLDNYNDEEWNIAKSRYEIIKDIVFKHKSKIAVEEVAQMHNMSSRNLYRWIKLYEESESISVLIPKTHKKGRRGSRLDDVVEKIIEDVIEEFYLTKQRIGFPKISMQIRKACKRLGIQPPHDNTVRSRIQAVDPKFAMKRRESYQKANKEFGNFEGEFPEGDFPLEYYQIDHTPLDIIVVDSAFRKPLGRPYLTLALDVYSRMIAGIYISLHGPGYFNVSQCLYNAFLPKDGLLKTYGVEGEWNIYGLPKTIQVDNGADLVSGDMQRVCEEFGITLMKRPVGRPQFSGAVERVFGTINKEVHNLPGTTFSNVRERGEYDSEKNATFTLEELTKWILEYIVNIYHKRTHHGIGMSPEQKYYIGIFGDENTPGTGALPSIIENEEEIKIALLPSFYRSVQKNGITLDGISYYSDVLRTWIGKKDKESKRLKFKIKRDPMNIQSVYFYDPEIKEYFEIYYRKLNAPKMTLWDLYAAKRYLKEKHINEITEEDLFDAYERLAEIELSAKESSKKQKIRKSKSPKMTDLNPKLQETEVKTTSISIDMNKMDFDELFDDVKTFDVFEQSK